SPPTAPGVHAARGVGRLPYRPARKPPDAAKRRYAPGPVAWPRAGTATVRLPAPSAGSPRVPVPGSPVWLQRLPGDGGYPGPATASVSVAGHQAALAAGASGVLLTVSAAAAGQTTSSAGGS